MTLMGKDTDELVIAASEYANSVPLTRFIRAVCPAARVVNEPPSCTAALLIEGRADAALVPVASALRQDALAVVPGIGVCARHAVRSVLLKCRRPVERIRSVAADPASCTSNALARIILHRRYGQRIEMRTPGAGGEADAEVMIGDRALHEPPAPCGDLDLAAEWHALTGRPFVCAVWACRAGDPRQGRIARILSQARKAGVKALPQLAASESERLGLPLAQCLDYFRNCIYYEVGLEEEEAMQRFGEMMIEENA